MKNFKRTAVLTIICLVGFVSTALAEEITVVGTGDGMEVFEVVGKAFSQLACYQDFSSGLMICMAIRSLLIGAMIRCIRNSFYRNIRPNASAPKPNASALRSNASAPINWRRNSVRLGLKSKETTDRIFEKNVIGYFEVKVLINWLFDCRLSPG